MNRVRKKLETRLTHLLIAITSVLKILSFGNPGEDPNQVDSINLLGSTQILGSITSVSGANLTGWMAVLVDTNTEISKVASISSAGIFSFNGVDTESTYTMVLLSPSMRLTSALFQPVEGATSLEYYSQNFRITNYILPQLVYDGNKMYFQNLNGVEFNSQLTQDIDQDGSADGLALNTGIGSQDLDNDGLLNTVDSDIDGDGLVNVFDKDDDNDGILDTFDIDSDGDLRNDSILQTSDQYFTQGVEWITVLYRSDLSTGKKTLTFLTKLREDSSPVAVKVLAPATITDGALVEYVDDDGNIASQAFNGMLLDAGNDDDSSAEDLIYGRTLTLNTTGPGSILIPDTMIFIQLFFGTPTNPVVLNFPYMISINEPSDITVTASMNVSGADLSLGPLNYNPYAGNNYFLSGQVFDSTDELVWSSSSLEIDPSVPPTGSFTTAPSGITTDTSCSYQAIARSVDRIPGYSNYRVLSAKVNGTCP